MPPKKKDDSEATIAHLTAQLEVKEKQLAAKNKEIKSLQKRADSSKPKLIPKPPGAASRSTKDGGYNVQEEMGLTDDDAHYSRLFHIVQAYTRQHLSIFQPITKQKRGSIENVITLVQKDVKFFRQFEGGWPIRDMIRTSLSNESSRLTKRMHDEADWEKENLAGVYVEEEEDVKSNSRTRTASQVELEDDEEMEPVLKTSAPKGGKGSKGPLKTKPAPSKSAEARPKKKQKKAHADAEEEDVPTQKKTGVLKRGGGNPQKSPSKRRKLQHHDDGAEEDEDDFTVLALAARSKENATTKTRGRNAAGPSTVNVGENKTKKTLVVAVAKKSKKDLLTWDDLPENCPSVECNHLLPAKPVQKILDLFQQAQDILDSGTSKGVLFLHGLICGAIREHKSQFGLRKLGAKRGWPDNLDAEDIRDRIFLLKDEILELCADKDALSDSGVWESFVSSINYELFKFIKAATKKEFLGLMNHTAAGYYGPFGESIISSCVQRIIAEVDDDEQLENEICGVQHDLVIVDEDPEHYQDYNDNTDSNYLSVSDFTRYVLVPFTTLSLIAMDNGFDSLDEAVTERDKSNDFGIAFNEAEGENDEIFHRINHENLRVIRRAEKKREEQQTGKGPSTTIKPKSASSVKDGSKNQLGKTQDAKTEIPTLGMTTRSRKLQPVVV